VPLLFALKFTGDIDPTALATIALATVTLVAVIVAGMALRQNQSEIDEARRPVLVPTINPLREVHVYGSDRKRARPFVLGPAELVVAIANLGIGPALNVQVIVTPRALSGERSRRWGDMTYTGKLVGVAVGELDAVVVRIPHLKELPSFDVWLTYDDVRGTKRSSSAKYIASAEGGAYIELQVT
jgi:hypothetical protein